MPDKCPTDFANLTCVPDHLSGEDCVRAANLIKAHVEKGEFKDARVWLEKAIKADPIAGRALINILIDDLSFLEYAQLMAVPKDAYQHVIDKWAGLPVQKLSFDEWMKKVDDVTYRQLGVSIHDLPDMPFRDSYDDETSPEAFVKEDLRDLLEEEGFDVDELLSEL